MSPLRIDRRRSRIDAERNEATDQEQGIDASPRGARRDLETWVLNSHRLYCGESLTRASGAANSASELCLSQSLLRASVEFEKGLRSRSGDKGRPLLTDRAAPLVAGRASRMAGHHRHNFQYRTSRNRSTAEVGFRRFAVLNGRSYSGIQELSGCHPSVTSPAFRHDSALVLRRVKCIPSAFLPC